MGRHVIVAGTKYEGRADVVRRHCRQGMVAELRREPKNAFDPNAIAVYIVIPVFFGLLGKNPQMIGYIKAIDAERLARKMDSGVGISARIASLYAPMGIDNPRVSLELEYDAPSKALTGAVPLASRSEDVCA